MRFDVEHIAKLARLGLTDKEKEKFQKELSSILDFVEKLKEVDVSKVEPMTGGTSLVNVTRRDEIKIVPDLIKSKERREKILKNAPEKKNGYIKVKAVFE